MPPPAAPQEPVQAVPGAGASLVEGGREPVAGCSGRDVGFQFPQAFGEGLLEPQEPADEPLPQPLEAAGAGTAGGVVQGLVSHVLEEDEACRRIGAQNPGHRAFPFPQQGENPLFHGEQVVGPAPGEAGEGLALGDGAAAAVEVEPPDPGCQFGRGHSSPNRMIWEESLPAWLLCSGFSFIARWSRPSLSLMKS